jgi:hypothetical protein
MKITAIIFYESYFRGTSKLQHGNEVVFTSVDFLAKTSAKVTTVAYQKSY